MHDVLDALFSKLLWIFTTSTNPLWSEIMLNKYCKKNASNNGTKRHKAYHVWRKMIGQNKGLGTMWKKIMGGGGAKVENLIIED